MFLVLITTLSVATASHYDPYHSRNQRIIKLHGSSYKHHPHHKHIRPGPLGPHVHYHDYDNDYHYEYVRPARPPPIPPFSNGPSSGPKFSPPSRGPSYVSYKGALGSYGNPYKSGNNFRLPVKDHFRAPSFPPKPPSTPSFEYLPTSSPSYNHVINADDNRGPIFEIPAPNLGPKPDFEKPIYAPVVKEIHETISPVKESPYLDFEKKPTYEVVESNDKIIEQPDGSKGYYAPDPDPSLPQPKIPPTNDPHSQPSKSADEPFPSGQEYQLVEAGPSAHAPIPNLSSQELYDLMHSFPNDQHQYIMVGPPGPQGLPQPFYTFLSQPPQPTAFSQPNYATSTQNSHQEVQNNGIIHTSSVNHQYQDFNNPHYQTFNYEESNPSAAAVPMEDLQNPFRYEQDASGSDSEKVSIIKSADPAKKTESVKKTLPSDLTNLIPDDDYEQEINQGQQPSPIFNINAEVPFYSSLPNRETAEALATLQAAGSIGSKINKLRGDQSAEAEDEEAENENQFFGLPQAEISKPVSNNPGLQGQMLVSDEFYDEPQDKKPEKVTVDVQKSVPLYEATIKSKSLLGGELTEDELLATLEPGQGAVSARFGRKIRPKS